MILDPLDFDYQLPPKLIANKPSTRRDSCRLMIINRKNGSITHKKFSDLLDLLTPNDVLVLNQSKVFPARIYGQKTSGGQVELLLLNATDNFTWEVISRPGLKINTQIIFPRNLNGIIIAENKIKFNLPKNKLFKLLNLIGTTPTPPYIKTESPESIIRKQYQTVYAKDIGSAAAPTAGLHFTKSLLLKLKKNGVQIEYLTLHVGLGTFQPLRKENLANHTLHHEFYEISPAVAGRLNLAKKQGKRIISVGTTSVRTLESAINSTGNLTKLSGSTNLFIYPGIKFNFVDSLITNFHLPQSSLLMLVSALATWPLIQKAYLDAISRRYRFFSFGDAMWII